MKKLLMLGTSYGTCLMLKYAKSQGVYTIVTDYNEPEHSPGKQISDEYWMINTGDLDALEAKCRADGVNAVVCGISEFNLEMCMELCRRLGLPCYCTPEAWHYSRDKVDYKALATAVGAPLATDYYLSDPPTRAELDAVRYPVVVKPVDLSCNRGISYVHNEEELLIACDYARSMSKSRKLVIERMLRGEEWYGVYALADGQVSLLGLCAMYAEPGFPKFCYSITSTLSNHVEDFCREINPHIENVLKAVGCREGYAWTQAMLDEDGHFYILEMGYRLDGDMMFVPFKDLLGFDTIAWIVDYALGKRNDPAQLPPSQQKAQFAFRRNDANPVNQENEYQYEPVSFAAEAGSRNMPQSGCICRIELGSMFVIGPSTAPFTASALRVSGQVQTIDFDHMICLMDIENAWVGTSSTVGNQPSPTCCIRHLWSSGTTK